MQQLAVEPSAVTDSLAAHLNITHLALAGLLRSNAFGLVDAGQEEVAVALGRRHLRRQPLLPHRLLVGCAAAYSKVRAAMIGESLLSLISNKRNTQQLICTDERSHLGLQVPAKYGYSGSQPPQIPVSYVPGYQTTTLLDEKLHHLFP